MNFDIPPSLDKTAEKILTKQEILAKFREFIPGDFRETQLLEDESGIYSFNVEIDGENPVVYYDADGMPENEHTVANLINNVWVNVK